MKKCIPNEYICNICNVTYSSRQNLWKHTNKYHNIEVTKSNRYTKLDISL